MQCPQPNAKHTKMIGTTDMRTPPKLTYAELSKRFKYENEELYRKKGDTYERVTHMTSVSIGYFTYSKGEVIYTLTHADADVGAGMKIDHIDGDLTNNHPDNLAPITTEQYEANKAQAKYFNPHKNPVYWDRRNCVAIARVGSVVIGRYKTLEDAQQALAQYKEIA